MTDTDIQFTDTDISVSAKYIGRYIGQPIYRSNPNIRMVFKISQHGEPGHLPEGAVGGGIQVHPDPLGGAEKCLDGVVLGRGVDAQPPGSVGCFNLYKSHLLLEVHVVGGWLQVWDGGLEKHHILEESPPSFSKAAR